MARSADTYRSARKGASSRALTGTVPHVPDRATKRAVLRRLGLSHEVRGLMKRQIERLSALKTPKERAP